MCCVKRVTNLLERPDGEFVPDKEDHGLTREENVTTRQQLRNQLVDDIVKLQDLIVRLSSGENGVRPERDELRGAVQIKQALLAGVRKRGLWT